MQHEDSILLGKTVAASKHYSPSVLYPVARQVGRELLGIASTPLPFFGVDVWHGYELSWLDTCGKPVVGMARFTVPCSSPNIVESKSFKLYLNSLNYTRFETTALLTQVLVRDLSEVAGAPIGVEVFALDRAVAMIPVVLEGVLLDELPINVDRFEYDPSLLRFAHKQFAHEQSVHKQAIVDEQLVSHLFRSNCPVTGQPDWASVRISYRGAAASHESVLAYLLSYRDHQEFHEQCVERIFADFQRLLAPASLCVEAFFTRRGGLDINPVRATSPVFPAPIRLVRQ